MHEAGQRGLAYLFKLRLTANVQRAIERLSSEREWVDAGQGWQAKESAVRLAGWSRQRRIIVLRLRVKGALAASSRRDPGPPQLSFLEIGPGDGVHEYCVLVTSLVEDLASFGQLYRDRGDAENIFDELKNQWGWGSFTTHDLARCRLISRAPRRAALQLVDHLPFVWPNRTGIGRRSPVGTPSPRAPAMRDKRRSPSPARTPSRFPPPRRSAPSPCFYALSPKLRSS